MLLSQLTYFEALARERHFGRAAAACFVTTSTLSEAVRKLEKELGVQLVDRGRTSFHGLTPDGEIVLAYARRMLADERHLGEDLAAAHGSLAATLRFGTIPSGTGWAADILARLAAANPGVTVDLVTGLRSEEIAERIRSHDLDAGIIHPRAGRADAHGAGRAGLHLARLGTTRFVLAGRPGVLDRIDATATVGGVDDDRTGIAGKAGKAIEAGKAIKAVKAGQKAVTGEDLAGLPLALLAPGMRAREEFDHAMAAAGVTVTPSAVADSAEALLALAGTGQWAVIVPEASVTAPRAGSVADLEVRRLQDPTVAMEVALVRLDVDPVPALAAAVDRAAR
ncbi:LysR family transcriptional regulator [Corynebacterium nuruki]|uniref:LysR family transcriptional regulator n=1 Tax=Corynebacterium nuruki TaxID=1032851 RepID=A0A3D4SXW3_9CORY|nr:LysR family transcriptional regulator [Corynebacterium nuruki]HCT14118.1 LysR family transcriptional regulator [Corynebacterium nuruki]